jgi:hypothetical protein
MTLLESLNQYTTVVTDTGDIDVIRQHRPSERHHKSISSLSRRRCQPMSTW